MTSKVVSIRFKENEYIELLMKVSDKNGNEAMSVSQFCKHSALTGKVTLFNHEIEEYKTFLLSKLSNDINQIADKLNSDNLKGNLSESIYINNLQALEKILELTNELAKPIR